MTELRQRMLDAMVQRGFAQRTQESYISAIRRMAKHYRRDPALYTQQDVQAYLLHMVKEDKLSYSSMIPKPPALPSSCFKPYSDTGANTFKFPLPKCPPNNPSYWYVWRYRACLRCAPIRPGECCCKPFTPPACASQRPVRSELPTSTAPQTGCVSGCKTAKAAKTATPCSVRPCWPCCVNTCATFALAPGCLPTPAARQP